MYFYQLLDKEKDLKIRIEYIEGEIGLIADGAKLEWFEHKSIEEADGALVEAKIALKEVHNQMRQLLLGE